MIRLTAFVSGNVQRVGYRAKVVSLAKEMGLVGIVQNRPDAVRGLGRYYTVVCCLCVSGAW